MTTNNNTHGILKMLATTNNACNRYLKCLIDITKMLGVMIRRAPEKGEHRKTTEQSFAVVEKKTVAGTKGGRDASIPDARPHAGGDGSHYYRNANLSRLGNPCCPSFPTGNARPGQKVPFFSCFPFLNFFLFQLYFCISIKLMYWNSVCMNIYI